jgi:BlaI family penicillinase repressor
MKQIKITDAELKLMEYVWETAPIKAIDLVAAARDGLKWNKNTTYTVLNRLVDKKVIARQEPNFVCVPLVTKESLTIDETNTLIDRMYEGSRKLFITSFFKSEKLSKEEIAELKRIIDGKE